MRVRVTLSWMVVMLALALPVASASGAGGATIATAPVVPFGVHEFGTTTTGKYECASGEYWILAMQPGDQATIDWESSQQKYAYGMAVYPAGTTDFSINNVNSLNHYYLSENNKAEAVFTSGTGGNIPIVFFASDCYDPPEGGPYDFTVTDQHAISVALRQFKHLKTTTPLTATANLTSGAPVPDGLAFTLTASWPGGSATYSATSAAGALSFPLALPESAAGKTATFVVTRAADTGFQAVKSATLTAQIGRRVSSGQSACEMASERTHRLAKRYGRLRFRAGLARGAVRRALNRRAAVVKRSLAAARRRQSSTCAGS